MLSKIYQRLGSSENLQKALDFCQKSLDIKEQLYVTEKTIEDEKELADSYNNLADIYTKIGDRANLEKSLELYKKCLNIYEHILKIEKTMYTYDNLVMIRYKIAMHKYTDIETKRQLLQEGLMLAKNLYDFERSLMLDESLYDNSFYEMGLYDELPNERYETFVRIFERELNNIDK